MFYYAVGLMKTDTAYSCKVFSAGSRRRLGSQRFIIVLVFLGVVADENKLTYSAEWLGVYVLFCLRTSNYSLQKCLMRQIKCQSGCSKESVVMVKRISRELSQVKNDSMLYTPTLDDYEQNCSKSTLMCFALEVNVLFVEIQSVAKYRSRRLPRILKMLTDKLQDKMKPCPDCEFYQEKRAETFLETLQDVLQRMNAEKSCAPKKNKRHLENFMKKQQQQQQKH